MIWPFKRQKEVVHKTTRLYEWRDQYGKRYGEPREAENACAFRHGAYLAGRTSERRVTGQDKQAGTLELSIYVTATGELVKTEIDPQGRGVRILNDTLPWYDENGKVVKL